MKMIILAAGQGTRLRPLTDNKPKCMVEYNDIPIINYIIKTTKELGIEEIAIISGYKKDVLEYHLRDENISFFTNPNYKYTNMVSTLFCAESFMDDDIIISYSDIIYKEEILKKLILSKNDFSVMIDKDWKELWLKRMDNPLEDAETLKIRNKKIIEIGKRAKSYSEIEGQYIGLIKISKSVIKEIINYYKSLNKNELYDGKKFDNMYMTSFIQKIIDNLLDVSPVYINGGWTEIDTVNDLKIKI
ncbi:MAG: phosphocholine cytidylyltransferase family protein [Arcobacter sp.]|uniref:phosphocholine cytidylyltransferase family protein n=1 Tax=Arcobacter sp. TaxID=1872629 RepID=UPI003C72B09E